MIRTAFVVFLLFVIAGCSKPKTVAAPAAKYEEPDDAWSRDPGIDCPENIICTVWRMEKEITDEQRLTAKRDEQYKRDYGILSFSGVCLIDPKTHYTAGKLLAVNPTDSRVAFVALDYGCQDIVVHGRLFVGPYSKVKNGSARSHGVNSPAVTGNGNVVTYGK